MLTARFCLLERDQHVYFPPNQVHSIVKSTAVESSQFFATTWTGGALTNRSRVLKSSVGFDPDSLVEKKKQPVIPLPDLLVFFDTRNNLWAAREGNQMLIPMVWPGPNTDWIG